MHWEILLQVSVEWTLTDGRIRQEDGGLDYDGFPSNEGKKTAPQEYGYNQQGADTRVG